MTAEKIRQRDKEKTRADILSAAEKLFALNGYAGTSLEKIAREVGVDRALIPYYFKNKSGLYRAIIAENVAIVRNRVEQSLFETTSAEDALRTYIRALIEAMSERTSFTSMIMREHISSAFMNDQESAAELLGFFKITQGLLDRGLKEKSFRKVDPHLFHLSLVGSIIYFVTTERFRQSASVDAPGLVMRPDLDTFIDHTCALLLSGLLTDT
ncbi:MAG: TetR/AcrR family transcriptional regulator [Alphaproteobacteria bacterium]|nr:MAG: TetR/AcrR family transcriptional regulator [Alphaproteobacteria bacterium]